MRAGFHYDIILFQDAFGGLFFFTPCDPPGSDLYWGALGTFKTGEDIQCKHS